MCWLAPAVLLAGAALAVAGGQAQRIQRQSAPATAAIVGIVRTGQGLGLGGVAIILQNLSTGRSLPASTASDGSFRFLNITPGGYQIQASREGFQPLRKVKFNWRPAKCSPLNSPCSRFPAAPKAFVRYPASSGLAPPSAAGAGADALHLSQLTAAASASTSRARTWHSRSTCSTATPFRLADSRVKVTPEININYLNVQENGIVNFAGRAPGLAGGVRRSQAEGSQQSVRLRFRARGHSNLHQRFSRLRLLRQRARPAPDTKTCTDCHILRDGDNNAWMAQLIMQGTNLVNFMGRYVYVAEGSKGFEAVPVAVHDDPPAVFGSDLQKLVYSKDYAELQKHQGELEEADHHAGNVLDVQLRSEYLYAALGKGGFRIYDVANIDNKDFSEKIVTAPVSPLGQRIYVKTRNATPVGSLSMLAVDPLRTRIPANEEQSIGLMYDFLYVTDAEEGLVVIGDPNLKC